MGRPRGEDTIRYVFRLSESTKQKLDMRAPPSKRARSPFIRKALESFISTPVKERVYGRPHMKDMSMTYVQVCATLPPGIVAVIKASYPKRRSVAIEAAIMRALED